MSDVAPDLQQRLSRWKRVEMPFSMEGMSSGDKKVIEEMVAACRDLENIYWRQGDPGDIAPYNAMRRSADAHERDVARLMWINGGRWDLVDENRPFIGKEPMPPGRSVLPPGMRREEIEAYVAQHPSEKKALYDEHALIERVSSSPLKLRAVPYHIKYRSLLQSAAGHLRKAAASSDDKAFAHFLRLRAKALLTDDFYESDLAWVKLESPKLDLIFAPYETYVDNVLGVKTSYGAAVLVRNESESRKLATFQQYVPDIQDALPLDAADRPSKRGHATPMEVMDAPFRAGDLRHGYQAVADNLPNDPRIHEKVGSKKIFFKNFMDARVDYIILPVARRLMRADQASRASAEGYLAAVMLHEISHGLGPSFAHRGGQQVDIREAVGPIYSGLEEAKADVTGMFGLQWLIDHGALPKARLEEYYASYVAGIFRTVRFGTGEAHGRAEMMEFNYLTEQGAITRDPDGRYAIDYAKIPGALALLTRELLTIEATGDRARAEAWFKKYEVMPAELRTALQGTSDIPVDIDPLVPFAEGVR